jgi:hypothetical protein
MAWYNEDNPDKLNFIVAGNHHSGYGLLQAALSAHPLIICHGDVLHTDDRVRRQFHEEYFGQAGKVADHFVPTSISLEQYLSNKIFDNTLHDERAVGVKVDYRSMLHYDLWEYLDHKSRAGDFCILHVVRNPVACYVSMRQRAVQNGQIAQSMTFRPVYIEPESLITFVREHEAARCKIDRLCTDRAVIPYHELILDFRRVLERVFDFLELKFSPACLPNQKRVHRKEIKTRVANWTQLKHTVPADVKEFMTCPSLF